MITEYRLNMIKRSIVNEKELFNNDFEIKELTKNVCENINCYAYSLGIMEPAPSGTNLYIPGFTTFEKVDYLSKENFILKVSEDLHNLKIEFREYGIDDEIIVNDNEYLIQVLFIPKDTKNFRKGIFHFSRKNKNGKWFSKMGWFYQPCFEEVETLAKLDNSELVKITSKYCSNQYLRIGYFVVKEKAS